MSKQGLYSSTLCIADKCWTLQLNGQSSFNASYLFLCIRGGKGTIQFFLKKKKLFFLKKTNLNESRLFYYSVPCLFVLCYLRVADVYRVPVERGDVGDCCQVIVQQTGTTHHMVPEDLSHHSFGNPVLDLQQNVEELRSSRARHLNQKTCGQFTKNVWPSYLLVGRCLVRLCEVQTEWKGQGLQYLW